MSGAVAFMLQPFGAAGGDLRLGGTIARRRNELELRYVLEGALLEGALGELVLPAPDPARERRDGLWQATCFECFLAVPGEEAYREVNLSPAGAWNIYRLDGYRRGLRPDPAAAAPAQRVRREGAGGLRLEVDLDLVPLNLATAPLEVAVTAVLEHRGGMLSYWALAHPGPEPDFHRRDGFRLTLPPPAGE